MEKVAGMMMLVRKAGSASAVCSHFMRTTLSIISAPTVISAGPIAYGGTLAARAARPSACWFLTETRMWVKDWAPGIAPGTKLERGARASTH